jgi:hypothetical protein
MKSVVFFLLCALACGCSTTRQRSARAVLREADQVLSREVRAREFERRLDELGARIEKGANPRDQVATIALPGKPGYFPPRTVRVVYEVTMDGLVALKEASITSMGRAFAEKAPNKSPDASTRTVTARANAVFSSWPRPADARGVAHLEC